MRRRSSTARSGDLATYSHNIEAAKKSDSVLQRKMESYKPEFELLLLPQVRARVWL